jgi:hypothetical protein
MTKPTIREHNLETNEIIDREMTDQEFAEHENDLAKEAERIALLEQAQLAKETAQAKLAALGFTADDLKALGL